MGCARVLRVAGTSALVALVLTGCGGDDDASVMLRAPADGSTIPGATQVDMVADGITIEEAGEVHKNAGHFHVIVDDGCVSTGDTVPKDADHVHFGKGQSTGTVYLSPGEHELCLQAADGAHNALAATDTVTVTAKIGSQDEWCEVIGEVDALFKTTDESGDEFAIKQVGYENIARLLAQLTDGLDQIDAAQRDDVELAIGFATKITSVFTLASDQDDAEARASEVFGSANESVKAAAPWILDTCGVDIDG